MQIKTFVINLDRRPDRMEALKVPFEFERFSAVDGTQFTDEIIKMRGHIGCWQSHRDLLIRIKCREYPITLVLEDDVELDPDFQTKIVEYMAQLPEDWDLFYVGGWNTMEKKKFSDNLDVAERVLTTHAYMIRDKFVDTLIQTLNNRRFKVDVVFCDALSKGKCYVASPVLAWQKKGYSDITNSVNSNAHLR